MGDEVSGSDRDISLSHIYVQFSSQRCVKGYRLVYRLTLKNKTKQRETNKSRRRGFQIHNVQCWKFTFSSKGIFFGFRSYDNLQADNQERKHPRWNDFGTSRETR